MKLLFGRKFGVLVLCLNCFEESTAMWFAFRGDEINENFS